MLAEAGSLPGMDLEALSTRGSIDADPSSSRLEEL
jgi:hypothetical protein